MENKKISIYYASKLRGFFKHIIENPPNEIVYSYPENNFYEKDSKVKIILRKIFTSSIADYLGIILKIKVDNDECDLVQTYNKFIKSDKPYLITLENPTAIYHYSLNRNKTILGKRRIQKEFSRGYLKAIVCISKACYSTANKVIGEIPNNITIEQIYPYIPNNNLVNESIITNRSKQEKLKCLFISSDFNLKSGQEIINVFEKLKHESCDGIELTIITDLNSINEEYKSKIKNMNNVNLLNFGLPYEELKKIYSENMILLHPTRQDSYALVVLEAIKAGMAVLATDLYAIPEMVKDEWNGYLEKPKYRFFTEENMPNPDVWNNRKDTIYSAYVDKNIEKFLYDKINLLNSNREKLSNLSLNSYKLATEGDFSEQYIKTKWENLYKQIIEKN